MEGSLESPVLYLPFHLVAASASCPAPGSPQGRGCPSIRLLGPPPLTASALSDAGWEIIAIIIEIFCS